MPKGKQAARWYVHIYQRRTRRLPLRRKNRRNPRLARGPERCPNRRMLNTFAARTIHHDQRGLLADGGWHDRPYVSPFRVLHADRHVHFRQRWFTDGMRSKGRRNRLLLGDSLGPPQAPADRSDCQIIAAPVQGDVDGMGSHGLGVWPISSSLLLAAVLSAVPAAASALTGSSAWDVTAGQARVPRSCSMSACWGLDRQRK
jgi:hypothetical protein